MRGQGEWWWYATWGVLTRVGAVVSQVLCFDHSLLLICSSVIGKVLALLMPSLCGIHLTECCGDGAGG